MSDFYNRVIKYSIYLLTFFLPLFFLPFSFEIYEFNKQYLLFFLVSIAFLAWMARMIIWEKEIKFRWALVDILVVAFLFTAILSAIFSVDKTFSLFGFYGRFSDGLVGLLSLGALYFLITNNNIKYRGQASAISVEGLLKTLLWSAFFVILISYLSIFRIWNKISASNFQLAGLKFQLPQLMLQPGFNPVSGSMEGLVMFLSLIIVLGIGIILERDKGKLGQLALYLLLLTALFLLLIIDFSGAWIVLLVTFTFFVGFALWKRILKETANKLVLPIIFLIISVIFLIIDLKIETQLSGNILGGLTMLPKEQILDQKISWKIATRAVIDNLKSGILGSGVGTFFYDFSKFRSVELNQSPLWQIRFDRAGNHIAEIIATIGIISALLYLFLAGLVLALSYYFLKSKVIVKVSKSKSKNQQLTISNYQLPLLMTFFALLVSQFVYYQNTVLGFMFWLIFGLLRTSWQQPISEKSLSFKNFPELSLIFSTLLIILGVALFGIYYFAGRFYLADMKYANATRLVQKVDSEERIKLLTEATNLNPYQSQYKIILARAYLQEALSEARKPPTSQDLDKLITSIANAINYAKGGEIQKVERGEIKKIKGATEISPNWVAAWETLGMVYREVQVVTGGEAIEWGIKAFEKAVNLEPTNPVLFTELGKLLVAREETEKAKEKFERAIELKSDYIDAYLQKAQLFEKEENLAEAIRIVEGLLENYPGNPEVLFQLGRFYFNNGKIDQAIDQFEKVIELVPFHANARYSLGIAYSTKGQTEEAIAEFEKVLELNPGNQDVMKKLEELKK